MRHERGRGVDSILVIWFRTIANIQLHLMFAILWSSYILLDEWSLIDWTNIGFIRSIGLVADKPCMMMSHEIN